MISKLTWVVLLLASCSAGILGTRAAVEPAQVILAAEDDASGDIPPLGTDYCGRGWRSELAPSDDSETYQELIPLVDGFPLDTEAEFVTFEEDEWFELSESDGGKSMNVSSIPKGYKVCCPKSKRTRGGLKVKCPFNGGMNVCRRCAKSTCHIGGGRKSACLKCAPCKRASKGCDKRCCGVCAEAHGLDKRSIGSCMSGCGCGGHDRKCTACKHCKKPWSKECYACKRCACK